VVIHLQIFFILAVKVGDYFLYILANHLFLNVGQNFKSVLENLTILALPAIVKNDDSHRTDVLINAGKHHFIIATE